MKLTQRIMTVLIFAWAVFFSGCGTQEAAKDPEASAASATPLQMTAEQTAEAADINAWLELVNTWPAGGKTAAQYMLVVENNSDTEIQDWEAVIHIPDGMKQTDLWNAKMEGTDDQWIIRPVEYNHTIAGGTRYSDVGFITECDTNDPPELRSFQAGLIHASIKRPAETAAESSQVPQTSEISAAEPAGALHVEGRALCNEAGEAVQLRGVSTHGINWYPEYVNAAAFQTLRDDWNVNTVRLAMYTMESKGYLTDGNREELLDVIDQGVAYTEQLGMYVIIDWHILSDRKPLEHVQEASEFFTKMAERYADKTHVIYEICNEPQGSPFEAEIKPYAEEIINVIRTYDSDAVILVGTNTWCQDIEEVIGHELDDENVMYTLHFYAGTHGNDLRQKLIRALESDVPVYISECSICDASGNGGINYESAQAWLDLIGQYQLSFNAWSLCNKAETSALIRPECSSVSGWKESDLSDTGIWFRNAFRGE